MLKSLKDQFWEDSLHLYFACLAVYMYPTDVKTAKPIWPKFWGIYALSKYQTLASIVIKFRKSTNFFYKICHFFVFVLQCIQKENIHSWNRRYQTPQEWILINEFKNYKKICIKTPCIRINKKLWIWKLFWKVVPDPKTGLWMRKCRNLTRHLYSK